MQAGGSRPPESPRASRTAREEDQAIVVGEFCQILGFPVARQIPGRCDGHERRIPEPLGHMVGIAQHPGSNREVDVFRDQLCQPIAHSQLDRDPRMFDAQGSQKRDAETPMGPEHIKVGTVDVAELNMNVAAAGAGASVLLFHGIPHASWVVRRSTSTPF